MLARQVEPAQGPKTRVLIQAMKEHILTIVDSLNTTNYKSLEDTSFFILKCTKVRPTGLTKNLSNFQNLCADKDLKADITTVIGLVEDMLTGGDAKMFVCCTKNDVTSKLEFLCVVVYKYMSDCGEACDYLLSSYSYTKKTNYTGMTAGVGLVGFGLLSALIGGIPGITIGVPLLMNGLNTIRESSDSTISLKMRDIVEAAFTYELTERAYVVIEDKKMYLQLDYD